MRPDDTGGGVILRNNVRVLTLVGGLVVDLEGSREVLAEEVARPALQRPAVLHQGFDRVGLVRTREPDEREAEKKKIPIEGERRRSPAGERGKGGEEQTKTRGTFLPAQYTSALDLTPLHCWVWHLENYW